MLLGWWAGKVLWVFVLNPFPTLDKPVFRDTGAMVQYGRMVRRWFANQLIQALAGRASAGVGPMAFLVLLPRFRDRETGYIPNTFEPFARRIRSYRLTVSRRTPVSASMRR